MAEPGAKVVNSSWLREHWPAERRPELHLVHPGVDLEVFRPDSAGGGSRQSGGCLRIAALGRDDVPWKGLSELRQALTRSAVRAELLLFGTPGRGTVERPWGREISVGGLSSPELAALFRSVDIVITASWFESFPLPPLEAMACGTAVVTTRPGTEDFAVDRLNALVVPGQDVAALAGAVAELAADAQLRRSLGQAGPGTAERFSWPAGFEAFERALAATER